MTKSFSSITFGSKVIGKMFNYMSRVSPSLIFDFRLLNSGMRPTPSDSPYLKTLGQVVGIIDS